MRYLQLTARLDAPVRLLCFPHAGGAAASYAGWARSLDTEAIAVVGAELPGRGRGSHEALCTEFDRIVGGFAAAITPFLDRPYALFGHSLGALVAFELARALRERGAPGPACLFVSGAFAPQLPATSAHLRFIQDDVPFLEAVAARYGGVPKIVLEQANLRASIVPALRADLALTETYVYTPAPPLPCAITAYAGADDPIVSADGVEQWRLQTSGDFSCRLFEGHHFYLNRARDALLADLTGRLMRLI
jgi:surfactin synthase thioesterase subunit